MESAAPQEKSAPPEGAAILAQHVMEIAANQVSYVLIWVVVIPRNAPFKNCYEIMMILE